MEISSEFDFNQALCTVCRIRFDQKSELGSPGYFQQSDSSRHILVLSYPICQYIVSRGPTEITDPWDLHTLLLKQTK